MAALVAQALSNGTPIAVPLTNTLNAVGSANSARIAAFQDRLPSEIKLLLLISAIITTLLTGYEGGKHRSMPIAGLVSFILLVTLAVYVTLDLNNPTTGIYASQQPIERVLSSMNGQE